MTMRTQMQLGRTGAAIMKLGLVLALGTALPAAAQQAYYIHADHLNTPRLIENQSQQVVWRWDNDDPFGANIANSNPSGLGAFTFNPRLPGQYFDLETNQHYNYFRDYAPETGRYIQSDPIRLEGGINTYTYVSGNPVSHIDPSGQAAVAAEVGVGIGVVCLFTPGCKELVEKGIRTAAKACTDAASSISNKLFSRPKNPPDIGPPGGWIQGPRRGRQYGSDGRPEYDIDKPHAGNQTDHVHEWEDGVREEPGRPVSPVPQPESSSNE
jgi:RHS repeat-associated protein